MWADDYELYSDAITEGDYLIVYSGKAMNTTVKNSRLQYETVTATNNIITTTKTNIVWHIAASGNYWTLYNANANAYAAGTGVANKAQMLSSGSEDESLWTVTGSSTYEFVNKKNTSEKVNKNLRNNGTYGFACYGTSTGGALSLYKKKAVVATALSVKTAPTKVNYKVGETLNLTGLVLDATIGGNHVDVTSGYTSKIGETAVTSGTTTLNTVGAQTITFTYGGQTATQTIHVGELKGIAITTAPTKTSYNEGQTFDPAGMVVTATFSDSEETPTEWTENVTEHCTFSPDGALETSDKKVTVSYEWSSVNKTVDQEITVIAGVPYTVTFNAGTGSCGTASLTEASFGAGVTLPTATIDVTGWSFAGWATASTTNTEVEPTLYDAGDTYNPTDNVTLYAVYKFSCKSSTNFIRATSVSDITSADKIVIAYNDGKVLNTNINMSTTLSEYSGIVTPASNAIFELSGDNTSGFTLTNGTNTIGTSGTGSSLSIALSSTNNKWTFSSSTYTTNVFHVNNVDASKSLEVYNNAWKAYALTENGQAWSMRIYVPASDYVYNSNPAAMINPTVAFTTVGNKSLYVQDNDTYNNPANVTGITKAITYTSSDETVATVTDAGVVTALKAGEATIKATVAAEVGVNSKAEASYVLTVKDAFTIAGLKRIDNTSGKSFVADLTDAVVTYVKDNYAYIQDASAAIMVNFASHGLTAGQKINGAVSGTVKITNSIDQLTALTLTDATVTEDGVIPTAAAVTLAAIKNAGTEYDGRLVSVSGATVTGSIATNASSGASIKDGSEIASEDVSMNVYAPNQGVEIKAAEKGTFSGFISLYNGSTYRLNIYEQSQIALTRNAPTDQPMSFTIASYDLSEDTPAYIEFAGQTVTGNVGTVTYSIEDGNNDDGIVTSINSTTGAVVLSGAYGTAIITATAAATELTEAGVTTPYTETIKSYTVTVRPRYYVTFSVNGVETTVRQASYGVTIAVPTPDDFGDYKFLGWCESTVDPTDDDTDFEFVSIGATLTPVNNSGKYYAVFAQERTGGEENRTSDFTIKTSSTPASPSIVGGVTWTHGGVSFANSASAGMPNGAHVTFALPSEAIKVVSVEITKTSNDWSAAKVSLPLTDSSDNLLVTLNSTTTSYNFTNSNNNAGPYTITANNTDSKVAYIDKITVTYAVIGTENYDYRTSLPTVELSIGTSGMLAFCYDRALDFRATDVKAYKAKVEGGVVKLTKVSDGIVPASTGVILAADQNDYEIPVATADATTDFSDNEMVGVTQRTQVLWNPSTDVYNYILQGGEFKKASTGFLKANRAYLSTSYNVSAASAREYLEISFEDDDVTGIDATLVNSEKVNSDIYDLQGRKVAQPTKGLYIVNGRKVIVK